MGGKVLVAVASGPLAPFAAGYESWLRSRSYSPSAAADRLCQLDQLGRWLAREGLGIDELTGEQAERFVAARRAAGRVTWVSPRSVMLQLGYLRELGVVPALAPAIAHSPLEQLLADYSRYLLIERRLCEHTVVDEYGPVARVFLAARETADGLALERLSAAEVTSFLARECPRRSASRAQPGVRTEVVGAVPAPGGADRRAVGVGRSRRSPTFAIALSRAAWSQPRSASFWRAAIGAG